MILLVGARRGWLGQSLYLREIFGREEGAPPPVDLAAEKRNGDFVRALIGDRHGERGPRSVRRRPRRRLAEMAMAGGVGATVSRARRRHAAAWFGEDQGRYLLAAPKDKAEEILRRAAQTGLPAALIGETGGDARARRRGAGSGAGFVGSP